MKKKDQIKTNSPENKKAIQTEIKFLATSWLDDFEKKTFNGKTVNELLNQRIYE